MTPFYFPRALRPAAFLLLFLSSAMPMAFAAAGPFDVTVSTIAGYDNNPNLDPSRAADGFAQETVGLGYHRLLSRKVNFRASYDLSNTDYFDATDQNALIQSGALGLDFWINRKTILETDYSYSYIYFPNDRSVTFDRHHGRIGLRYRPSPFLNLKAGIGTWEQEFEDRKMRLAGGVLSEDERKDGRLIADGEAALRLWNGAFVKFGYSRGLNDSNEQFFDFYDYSLDRFSASASVRITPKVSSFVKFSYEMRGYKTRPLIGSAERQSDDVYTLTAAAFYRIRHGISLGAVYFYRQKDSNEPSQRYSGSISTLGLYYSF